MRNLSLNSIERAFHCAEDLKVKTNSFDFPELEALQSTLTKIGKILGEDGRLPVWGDALRFPSRLRYQMILTPISPSWQGLEIAGNVDVLRRLRSSLISDNDTLAAAFDDVIDAVLRLGQVEANPSFLRVLAESGSQGPIGLVIKEARWMTATAKFLSGKDQRLRLVTPQELKGDAFFEQLFCFGPVKWWLSEKKNLKHILLSPRSQRIDFLKPSFIPDAIRLKSPFLGSDLNLIDEAMSEREIRIDSPSTVKGGDELEEDTVESINWDEIRRIFKKRKSSETITEGEEEGTEVVEAKLVILDSNIAVYLEGSDHAYSLIIDPSFINSGSRLSDDEGLAKIVSRKVSPGMFILLRTDAEGDYIEPLANELLREDKDRCRQLQANWKAQLTAYVGRIGEAKAIQALSANGTGIATKGNLRNWMARRLIRPRDDRRFSSDTFSG